MCHNSGTVNFIGGNNGVDLCELLEYESGVDSQLDYIVIFDEVAKPDSNCRTCVQRKIKLSELNAMVTAGKAVITRDGLDVIVTNTADNSKSQIKSVQSIQAGSNNVTVSSDANTGDVTIDVSMPPRDVELTDATGTQTIGWIYSTQS